MTQRCSSVRHAHPGIDGALRVGALPDSSLVARQVGIACWVAFASPAYLRSAAPLAKLQDLGGTTACSSLRWGRRHGP